MRPEALLLLLIVLACPLMMIFMMRGGHRGDGADAMHADRSRKPDDPTVLEAVTLGELRSRRDALASEIARRESSDAQRPRASADA